MLVLGCSSTKRNGGPTLPAWQRYDGPAWRVLRKRVQPSQIESQVMVLSARYGLIPSDTHIEDYDQRMTVKRASELREATSDELRALLKNGGGLLLVLGRDYLLAVEDDVLKDRRVEVVPGTIGLKLRRVRLWAEAVAGVNGSDPSRKGTHFYMPEWDDRVDPSFNFATDTWSGPTPGQRKDKYAHQLVSRPVPYDGMLVSLAQIKKKKGVLKNGAGNFSSESSVRKQLGLPNDMTLMGDCGAFSYIEQTEPPYSPKEAVELYEQLGFDVGASVDHIVFPGMTRADATGGRYELTEEQLQERVNVTRTNAQRFFAEAQAANVKFTPMGVIQATTVEQFGDLFLDYVDMGYKYVALGGLVPKPTSEIVRVIEEINDRKRHLTEPINVKLHLFGVMRELLIPQLAELGVTSFDSASYLRKAWLRSEKNYLSYQTGWYAAIRVPFHKNPRVKAGNRKVAELEALEQASLRALMDYDQGLISSSQAVSTVLEYDQLLTRKTTDGNRLEEAYTRTLEEKPWKNCVCPFCRAIGIHIVIFRGINRNRRRGFHNVWVFKRKLEENGNNREL